MRVAGLVTRGLGQAPYYVCRSCRRFSSRPGPPAEPPASGFAALSSSRRLISVSGPDAAHYLHGIITSSIVDADGRNEGFYTGFLSATGRVLHDTFVYPDIVVNKDGDPGQSFLVEVDANQAERLQKHIKKYKLRSKFKVRLLDSEEATVWQAWDDSGKTDFTTVSNEATGIQLRDPRTPTLGTRFVTAGLRLPQIDLDQTDESAYQIRRYLQGVPEGQEEILHEHALPLESNMDVMHGINFRKGCYMGQELTIRTKHQGIVRKRILPCVIYPEDRAIPDRLAYRPTSDGDLQGLLTAEMIPEGTSIGRVGKKGRSTGKWLRGVGNIGLVLCRLETMTDVVLPGETAAAAYSPENEFVLTRRSEDDGSPAVSVKIKAFVPEWLRQGLAEQSQSQS